MKKLQTLFTKQVAAYCCVLMHLKTKLLSDAMPLKSATQQCFMLYSIAGNKINTYPVNLLVFRSAFICKRFCTAENIDT